MTSLVFFLHQDKPPKCFFYLYRSYTRYYSFPLAFICADKMSAYTATMFLFRVSVWLFTTLFSKVDSVAGRLLSTTGDTAVHITFTYSYTGSKMLSDEFIHTVNFLERKGWNSFRLSFSWNLVKWKTLTFVLCNSSKKTIDILTS